MEKREREGYRYCKITETENCGKCKHLLKPLFSGTIPPYYCDVHKEPLPEYVVDFFADACKEFEQK